MGRRQQRGPRLSWSQADKQLFISFFANDIARGKVPGKEAVEQFIQKYPQMARRGVSKIKDAIRNHIVRTR